MNPSRRRVLKVLLGGIGAAALTRGADAANRVRSAFVLFPTSAALNMKLSGVARTEVRENSGRELITVQVESRSLAAGTQLDVLAVNPSNDSSEAVLVGTLTLSDHPRKRNTRVGTLEVKNYNGGTLPEGLSVVSKIAEFRITAHNEPATVLMSSNTAGNPGGGNGGGSGGNRRQIILTQTSAGFATGTTGTATTSMGDGRERFTFEVQSTGLPKNSVVELRFDHATNGDNYFAGLFLLLPNGSTRRVKVEWDSVAGPFPPAGSTPVSQLTRVRIIRQSTGEVLLEGSFEGNPPN